jgi:hypothetical protein
MTSATSLHQPSNRQPFLPQNFYEAPQYASLKPVFLPRPPSPTTIATHLRSVHHGATRTTSPRQRKTLRTVMFDADGRLQSAKIDLETGEVRQHDYKDYFEKRSKPRRKLDALDTEPFWMRMPAATHSTGLARQHDGSRKKLFNGVKMYLQHLVQTDDLEESLAAIPFNRTVQSRLPTLADIIESANLLGIGGSTRGLVQTELLAMLTKLDFITPKTVREFKGCSVRHSERIAGHLRVIVRAFMAHAEASSVHLPLVQMTH